MALVVTVNGSDEIIKINNLQQLLNHMKNFPLPDDEDLMNDQNFK